MNTVAQKVKSEPEFGLSGERGFWGEFFYPV